MAPQEYVEFAEKTDQALFNQYNNLSADQLKQLTPKQKTFIENWKK